MMPKALLIPCARCSPLRLLPHCCWLYQDMLNSAEATVAGLPDHATTVEPSTCAPATVCRYL